VIEKERIRRKKTGEEVPRVPHPPVMAPAHPVPQGKSLSENRLRLKRRTRRK
jgi:hypothetical protein